MQALTDGLKDFASALAQSSAVDLAQIPDLDGLINLTRSAITNSILDKAREQHAYPLRRVLAFLGFSIDDLCNNPIVKNQVFGYFKLYKDINRRMEISDLERQWNPVGRALLPDTF